MSYESVDKLQKVLQNTIFHYTKDSKKAAGRALGTMVEIITYYLLKSWGLNDNIAIERGLAEYGNPEITHNVEYSLHPVIKSHIINVKNEGKSITSNKIFSTLKNNSINIAEFKVKKASNLISNKLILRNACTIALKENSYLLSCLNNYDSNYYELKVYEQLKKAFAIFECKRVGIEEGNKKGPQTIEKAKQGAYVARTISSLQKIRNEKGEMLGLIYKSNDEIISKPYTELMDMVINSNDKELLRRFILSIGVVSNHGNWFTSSNHNKELKVLAQSYDWLLFLTDKGLSNFIDKLLLNPSNEYKIVKEVFNSSYVDGKKKNQFTKIQMNLEADKMLIKFFKDNLKQIESWFNTISPVNKKISTLKNELYVLKNKDWAMLLI